jgi:hypothetical protein
MHDSNLDALGHVMCIAWLRRVNRYVLVPIAMSPNAALDHLFGDTVSAVFVRL